MIITRQGMKTEISNSVSQETYFPKKQEKKETRPVLTELPAYFAFGTLDRLSSAQYLVNKQKEALQLLKSPLKLSSSFSGNSKQLVRTGIGSVLHHILSRSQNY